MWPFSKQKQLIKKAEQERLEQELKSAAEEKADRLNTAFLQKKCPYNSFKNCRADCVFFKKAYTRVYMVHYELCSYISKPACGINSAP